VTMYYGRKVTWTAQHFLEIYGERKPQINTSYYHMWPYYLNYQ